MVLLVRCCLSLSLSLSLDHSNTFRKKWCVHSAAEKSAGWPHVVVPSSECSKHGVTQSPIRDNPIYFSLNGAAPAGTAPSCSHNPGCAVAYVPACRQWRPSPPPATRHAKHKCAGASESLRTTRHHHLLVLLLLLLPRRMVSASGVVIPSCSVLCFGFALDCFALLCCVLFLLACYPYWREGWMDGFPAII